MNILIICPKSDSYQLKDTESKRLIQNTYKEWFEFLQSDKVKFRCFIEDALACEMVKKFDVKPITYYTAIRESNMTFLDLHIDKFPEWKEWSLNAQGSVFCGEPVKNKLQVPLAPRFKDRNEYISAKIEYIRNSIRVNTTEFIKISDAVLMFRAGGNQDTYSSLLKHKCDGDGKLLIEVDIKTGTSQQYYGGTYLDKDIIQTLINM